MSRAHEYGLYNAKPPPPEGRQITFPDSIHFIVEAIHPGNGIFDETGEIPVVAEGTGARKKNTVSRYTNPGYIHQSLAPAP